MKMSDEEALEKLKKLAQFMRIQVLEILCEQDRLNEKLAGKYDATLLKEQLASLQRRIDLQQVRLEELRTDKESEESSKE